MILLHAETYIYIYINKVSWLAKLWTQVEMGSFSLLEYSDIFSEKIEKLVAITKVLHQKFDNFSFHVNRQASQPSSSATDVIVIINNPVDLD